jgi:hypothetical protein
VRAISPRRRPTTQGSIPDKLGMLRVRWHESNGSMISEMGQELTPQHAIAWSHKCQERTRVGSLSAPKIGRMEIVKSGAVSQAPR